MRQPHPLVGRPAEVAVVAIARTVATTTKTLLALLTTPLRWKGVTGKDALIVKARLNIHRDPRSAETFGI
jgi:hypothetical protein